ncbi:MAG: TetR/AcrR family transcriptional regulator [Pseudomonas sp.]|uniref:TetR/AcrR family transcriptional regulator n=1 Tax=Pseudomonas sp. TaxID=306 RepID=UPI003D0B3572
MRPANPAQREARCNALLDAAARCFAQSGFVATRTADICLLADMSAGNLFHYFPSKQAVLLALIAREGLEIQQAMDQLLQQQAPLLALQGFLQHVCQLVEDPNYTGLALEIAALSHRDAEVARLARHNDQLLRSGLAALVRQASDLGLTRAELCADQAATWLAALIDGLFTRIAVDPQFTPQTQAPMLQQLALHLLQGN